MNVLAGIGILVTRDAKQAADLRLPLEALGATVFEFPLIEIRHPASLVELDAALQCLNSYNWIVFASANAVDFFLERMQSLKIPMQTLQSCSLAAVGAKTAARLEKCGLRVSFTPQEFSGESFAEEFCQNFEPKGIKFLWPRTNIGNLQIKELLENSGASVEAVVAYETHLPKDAESRVSELIQLIEHGKLQVITLTSSQCARNLRYLLERRDGCPDSQAETSEDLHPLKEMIVATLGAETTTTVAKLFDCKLMQSKASTIPDLISTMADYFSVS